MRQWYELDFTPYHTICQPKHYNNVTDIMIDGQTLKQRDEGNYQQGKADAIEEFAKALIEVDWEVNLKEYTCEEIVSNMADWLKEQSE